MIEENVLKYLRNTFADSEKLQLYPARNNNYFCSFEDVIENKIPKCLVENIFEDYTRNIKRNIRNDSFRNRNQKNDKAVNEEEDPTPKVVQIFLFPLVYKLRFEHNKQRLYSTKTLYPLCIPALLFKEGSSLSGDKDLQPFIPRPFLSPQSQQRLTLPVIADLEAHDTYISQNQSEREETSTDWKAQLEKAKCLWKELTKEDLNTLNIEGYEQQFDESVILVQSTQASSKHIFTLYDELIKQGNIKKLPLLKKILKPSSIREPDICPLRKSPLSYPLNKAQMQSGRSLSSSQKSVLQDVLDHPDKIIRVVNGPPGTGKTTLLQSVISNLWVQAAIDQKMPPLIVAASSNNNAIINVTNSFKSEAVGRGQDHFYKRWVPNIDSFGLYCASANKLDKKNLEVGWVACEPRQDVFSVQTDLSTVSIESISFLDQARLHFIDSFQKWSGIQLTELDDIKDYLHKQLIRVSEEIETGCRLQKEILNFNFSSYKKFNDTNREIDEWKSLKDQLAARQNEMSLIKRLMIKIPSMPFFSSKAKKHIAALTKGNSLLNSKEFDNFHGLDKYISENIADLHQESFNLYLEIDKYETSLKSWKNWAKKHRVNDDISFLDQSLDRNSLRHEMFYLCVHYWESRWILDMKMIHQKRQNKSFSLKELYQVRAQLTPCFISTFHMLPTFFNTEKEYLYNCIDYLIVDEAGQVNTHNAVPSFALAQKALIVGDIKQLEPINVLPEPIDVGNSIKFNIIEDESDYEEFSKTGLSITDGSIMHRAHALCDFKIDLHIRERGFFLKEHWRSVPEIASYCNEIAYAGALEPMRLPEKNPFLPPMGFAHITGDSKRQNGSLYNEKEAEVIIKWLSDHQEVIQKAYPHLPFEKIVGIITPYRAQVTQLEKFLKRTSLPNSLAVGTVHTFQGTERPIIIFSPAYGRGDSTYFITRSVNFLNVTVSRAKDHFFVFGNMSVLRQSSGGCLEQLNRKLFLSQDNEIKGLDIRLTNEIISNALNENLNTLESHQNFLMNSLNCAKERLLIHSPFLSVNALQHGDLIGSIRRCVERGVHVCVVTEENFENRNKRNLQPALQAEKLLKESGVDLRYFYQDHSKMLCLDDHTYTGGSFNWLSASRDSRYANNEHTIVCYNSDDIPGFIKKTWDKLSNTTSLKRRDENIDQKIA